MDVKADDAPAYRKRAAEMRERAAHTDDPESRKLILSAAVGYDYLADVLDNLNERQLIH